MSHTVLIVEDDPRFRELFAEAVCGAPDLVLAGVATDFAQGVGLLEELQPDVLLVDLGLPDGSGIGLIQRADERLPQCESMVITVFGDDQSVLRSIEAGATGYLLKDSRTVDVVAQIRLLCNGGSPISPVIARWLLKRVANSPPACATPARPAVGLSEQECSVLAFSAKGYNYQEIATLMKVKPHTVETYVKRVYRKLQVHTKTEAVYEARKLGFVKD